MISICIIEDIKDIQEGLKNIIESDSRFHLKGCFENAEDAIKKLPHLQPDVVITDINLPNKSGIDCIRETRNKLPDTQFIMFTIYEDNDQVFDALKAGASGYILKNTSPDKLVESLIEIHNGGSPMSPKIARKVLSSFSGKQNLDDSEQLSYREIEVLEYLSKGFLYKEIADKMNLSTSTIKTHINHIYAKLQVHNKTEALNKFYNR